MQTENSQPEGKRIMPETRITEFPTLSVDPRVGISENYVRLFFLTYDIKKYCLSLAICFIFEILCRITTFLNVFHCFSRGLMRDVTSEIQSSEVILTLRVSCQPIGKQNLPTPLKKNKLLSQR